MHESRILTDQEVAAIRRMASAPRPSVWAPIDTREIYDSEIVATLDFWHEKAQRLGEMQAEQRKHTETAEAERDFYRDAWQARDADAKMWIDNAAQQANRADAAEAEVERLNNILKRAAR